MRDITSAKGLSDLRTATTHHIAAKPPRQGTTYLDLYSVNMEKQRLEKELSRLEHRQKRIYERLGEIQQAMEKLEDTAQREKIEASSSANPDSDFPSSAKTEPEERQWKKMTVNY